MPTYGRNEWRQVVIVQSNRSRDYVVMTSALPYLCVGCCIHAGFFQGRANGEPRLEGTRRGGVLGEGVANPLPTSSRVWGAQ